jgi:hypothetical protein
LYQLAMFKSKRLMMMMRGAGINKQLIMQLIIGVRVV